MEVDVSQSLALHTIEAVPAGVCAVHSDSVHQNDAAAPTTAAEWFAPNDLRTIKFPPMGADPPCMVPNQCCPPSERKLHQP